MVQPFLAVALRTPWTGEALMKRTRMRFLLAAEHKNSRRMRLEQLLLLAVRCLLLLLLILGMASVTPTGML